MIENVLSF